MRFQIVWAVIGVLVAVILLVFSKFVRAIFRESIVHPHHHCEIEVGRDKVTVRKIEHP